MKAKGERRVHVGRYLTFLFENRDTIRYQVQEMMRAERMVREADIPHEIETYNELLGAGGDLGCTLLIEIDDPAERAEKLGRWLGLPQRLYAKLEDGTKRPRALRRAPGRRRAALLGAVPEVPGRWPRAGGDRLRPRRPRRRRRGGAFGRPAGRPGVGPVQLSGFRSGFARAPSLRLGVKEKSKNSTAGAARCCPT